MLVSIAKETNIHTGIADASALEVEGGDTEEYDRARERGTRLWVAGIGIEGWRVVGDDGGSSMGEEDKAKMVTYRERDGDEEVS